ncbi:MAG: adenylate/guanylate cyclase domain-containing protein [Anaerolineales bacterium]|nr:adenylate/guanylate cyclase domain-containing protein [Anaerolineales bacterium]
MAPASDEVRPPTLSELEPKLRSLLPAKLYAEVWIDPAAKTVEKVFNHLRTLQTILYDYLPRQVAETPPKPGRVDHAWQEGTLMFTDLAGFTPLMEANASLGKTGAESLKTTLNDYFSTMIDIIGKSSGNLLEFTGDAMLIQFPMVRNGRDTAQAVRAALRMQRAMAKYGIIQTANGVLSLGMRIGIHFGRFFTAEIGTPFRMEHVLLGGNVQKTKHAEGAGIVGRVNLTDDAYERVKDRFHIEDGQPGHKLIIDDIQDLDEYEFATPPRRLSRAVLIDRGADALLLEISRVLTIIEPLASYLPRQILNLLVETAGNREIYPDFTTPTVVFVNLIGLPESVDHVQPDEEEGLANSFSRVFGQINAEIEAKGGVLKKVTCHLSGSDIMIFFGVPSAHTDDTLRACKGALKIRAIIEEINENPPIVDGKPISAYCQIGIAKGAVFAAEIGDKRGRREFNVLGDAVNTAARLMGKAARNQILMTPAVYAEVSNHLETEYIGEISLKGKATAMALYSLKARKD